MVSHIKGTQRSILVPRRRKLASWVTDHSLARYLGRSYGVFVSEYLSM